MVLVAYVGYAKYVKLHQKPVEEQLKIHAEWWIAWTHTMALIQRRNLTYYTYFTEALFDAIIPIGGIQSCRGTLYGVLWLYGVFICFGVQGIRLYWTLTTRVQMVPIVKKYQMFPPPKIKKTI